MDRRDFLLLKTKGRERVLELSCERLYMRWADARSSAGGPAAATRTDGNDPQPWEGEPPTEVVTMSTTDLFAELERKLAQADVLRVLGRDWLADLDFRHDVGSLVEAFRVRGGRVE
jgi:hypothetical protein